MCGWCNTLLVLWVKRLACTNFGLCHLVARWHTTPVWNKKSDLPISHVSFCILDPCVLTNCLIAPWNLTTCGVPFGSLLFPLVPLEVMSAPHQVSYSLSYLAAISATDSGVGNNVAVANWNNNDYGQDIASTYRKDIFLFHALIHPLILWWLLYICSRCRLQAVHPCTVPGDELTLEQQQQTNLAIN